MKMLRNFLYLDSDLLDSYYAAFDSDLEEDAHEQEKRAFMIAMARLVDQLFIEDELKSICFELGEQFENLPAETKTGKVRELVLLVDRKGLFGKLLQICHRERPDADWSRSRDSNHQLPAVTNAAKFQRLYAILEKKGGLTSFDVLSASSWSRLSEGQIVELKVKANLTNLAVLSATAKAFLTLGDLVTSLGGDMPTSEDDRRNIEGIDRVRQLQEQAGIPLKMILSDYQMLAYLKQQYVRVPSHQLIGEMQVFGKITKKLNSRRQRLEINDPLGSPLGLLGGSELKHLNAQQRQHLLKSKTKSPTHEVMGGPALSLDLLAVYR